VLLDDERPSGELLLSSGSLPATNQSDFLMFKAELLSGDKYFIMKQQVGGVLCCGVGCEGRA
jgi:hypothetical protein